VSYKPLDFHDPLPFGKYKDHEVTTIIDDDPEYLQWMQANTSIQFTDDVKECILISHNDGDYQEEEGERWSCLNQ